MTEYEPIHLDRHGEIPMRVCVTHKMPRAPWEGCSSGYTSGEPCDVRDLYVEKNCGATFSIPVENPGNGIHVSWTFVSCGLRPSHSGLHVADHSDEETGVEYTVRWPDDIGPQGGPGERSEHD